ncbi:ABC transporter ATP-binding protein [Oscillatoria sp. FACHB-1407]|uniref:ABC transporter ATP-binding protein n=1 Tax=Oscillatoria sp. FACHB-1407 TaxID=2692847 RepID=UPI001687294D|nr:ABC transporter ATP-binding protein [Oscillatoria sp. FACHB-1407]MBD2465753.1 ABC transporter ATP-binding protein [Oscillatoria sp. FACHB-1407]
MLKLEQVETYYSTSQVLFGVDLSIGDREVVTLLGRNGMGKTTTVKSILGIQPPKRGRVLFQDREMQRLPSYKVAQAGIGLVPEGRQIFPNLSVQENLVATANSRRLGANAWTLEKAYTLFPRLAERRHHMGNQLSGGEQQMLAIARALLTNPKLLILDEATEGLAPLIRAEIWRCLERLKQLGQAILVIDKNLDALMQIADRHFVIEKGRIVWTGTSVELQQASHIRQRYLGV